MAVAQCGRMQRVCCQSQLTAVCRPSLPHASSIRLSRSTTQFPASSPIQPLRIAPSTNLPVQGGCVVARRKVVVQSFLGVGAPEALLVAVVALVVFGPKGLADAARSVGQALRSFQPTIREVVEVSQEVKGTLERELGLDELRDVTRPRPYVPPPPAATSTSASSSPSSSTDAGYTPPPGLQAVTDEVARSIDPDIEAKRVASEAAAWGGQRLSTEAAAAPAAAAPQVQQLSIEELEAELARRKAATGGSKPPSA